MFVFDSTEKHRYLIKSLRRLWFYPKWLNSFLLRVSFDTMSRGKRKTICKLRNSNSPFSLFQVHLSTIDDLTYQKTVLLKFHPWSVELAAAYQKIMKVARWALFSLISITSFRTWMENEMIFRTHSRVEVYGCWKSCICLVPAAIPYYGIPVSPYRISVEWADR